MAGGAVRDFYPEARDSGQFSVDCPGIDLALESARSSISVARTRPCQEGKVHEATCGPICLFGRSAILNYRKSIR